MNRIERSILEQLAISPMTVDEDNVVDIAHSLETGSRELVDAINGLVASKQATKEDSIYVNGKFTARITDAGRTTLAKREEMSVWEKLWQMFYG